MVRTARVQMSSRLMGDHVYHAGGTQRLVRNAVLRGKSPEDHYRSLEWLYGGTGLDSGVRGWSTAEPLRLHQAPRAEIAAGPRSACSLGGRLPLRK